jgi:hypothetical protein
MTMGTIGTGAKRTQRYKITSSMWEEGNHKSKKTTMTDTLNNHRKTLRQEDNNEHGPLW